MTRTALLCLALILPAIALADTITGHAIIMARRFDADFSKLPNLSTYADRLEARPAFQLTEAA